MHGVGIIIILEDKDACIASTGCDRKFASLVRKGLTSSFKWLVDSGIAGVGFVSFMKRLREVNFCQLSFFFCLCELRLSALFDSSDLV